MKVIIAGSRNFNDYKFLEKKCDKILIDIDGEIIILSGTASGADTLGEAYAKINGYKIEYHPAQWNDLTKEPCKLKENKYGKLYNALAGFNRNQEMVDVADMLIAFRVNFSNGTSDVINRAREKGIPIHVFDCEGSK